MITTDTQSGHSIETWQNKGKQSRTLKLSWLLSCMKVLAAADCTISWTFKPQNITAVWEESAAWRNVFCLLWIDRLPHHSGGHQPQANACFIRWLPCTNRNLHPPSPQCSRHSPVRKPLQEAFQDKRFCSRLPLRAWLLFNHNLTLLSEQQNYQCWG